MSRSIMQTDVQCYLCGRKTCLERHHVMSGTANRKLAERYGLWVYCCHDCHTGTNGVQYNGKLNKWLRAQAQMAFEEAHSHEEWMKVFMKNYL